MIEPAEVLPELAARLRAEDSVISPLVADPTDDPWLGRLVAAGPAATADPGAFALVIESVREGYLLHYGRPRLLTTGGEPGLTLLAGDYLYALGLELLARLDAPAAVRELASLITALARVHAEGLGESLADALWIDAATAIALGEDSPRPEPEAVFASALPSAAGPAAAAAGLIAGAHARVRAASHQPLIDAFGRAVAVTGAMAAPVGGPQ